MKQFLIVLFVLLFAATAIAQDVTLQWDPNTETDLAGYKIYYGPTSGEPYSGQGAVFNGSMFNSPIDIALPPTVNGAVNVTLDMPNGTWYFVVTAYDNEDPVLESDYSNQVSSFSSNGLPGQPTNVRIVTVP